MSAAGSDLRRAQPGLRTLVVVPVFDGEDHLRACVGALLATTGDGVDILLVDDGSRDASVSVASSLAEASQGRVRVLALGRNHGFAGAVNRAIADALASTPRPSILALVNQDCVVRPGWLAPLVAVLADDSVAIAGARLYEADGVTLSHAGGRIEANALTSHLGRGSKDPGAWRRAAEAEYVCGALVAMTTATWTAIGPFDEGYGPAYFEDVDLCIRARRGGRRVVYVPDSEAVHAEASTSGVGSPLFLSRYHRARLRFAVRHRRGRAFFGWMIAEAAWLSRLRTRAEIRPVLAAYARIPRFAWELVTERLASRRAGSRADAAAAPGGSAAGLRVRALPVVEAPR